MNLDLYTLEYVKTMFNLHSDHSSNCNGYRSLCSLIEQENNKQKGYNINPEKECNYYEPDSTTAMNCRFCGKSQFMHFKKQKQ